MGSGETKEILILKVIDTSWSRTWWCAGDGEISGVDPAL